MSLQNALQSLSHCREKHGFAKDTRTCGQEEVVARLFRSDRYLSSRNARIKGDDDDDHDDDHDHEEKIVKQLDSKI